MFLESKTSFEFLSKIVFLFKSFWNSYFQSSSYWVPVWNQFPMVFCSSSYSKLCYIPIKYRLKIKFHYRILLKALYYLLLKSYWTSYQIPPNFLLKPTWNADIKSNPYRNPIRVLLKLLYIYCKFKSYVISIPCQFLWNSYLE